LTPRIIAITALVGVIFAIVLYLGMREDKAEQRGVDKQVAADIAKANQELAVKRERDAKFDKMDARAFCLDGGFEWVFEDNRSFCR
jgi:hypothetical protein